jgi:hypothetical protein
LTLSFRPHYGPGVNSASNRNEYQEYGFGQELCGRKIEVRLFINVLRNANCVTDPLPTQILRRLRWSSGSHAGLWFPSSRVQTRPKPLDFSAHKNPQHAFIQRGS